MALVVNSSTFKSNWNPFIHYLLQLLYSIFLYSRCIITHGMLWKKGDVSLLLLWPVNILFSLFLIQWLTPTRKVIKATFCTGWYWIFPHNMYLQILYKTAGRITWLRYSFSIICEENMWQTLRCAVETPFSRSVLQSLL